MKAFPWWRSFRVRLALGAMLGVLAVMFVYAGVTYLRWEKEMRDRLEDRLKVIALQMPEVVFTSGRSWYDSPRWQRFREAYRGPILSARRMDGGDWLVVAGEWPEALSTYLHSDTVVEKTLQWPKSTDDSDIRLGSTRGPGPRERGWGERERFSAGRAVGFEGMRFEQVQIGQSSWLVGGLRLEDGVFWIAENIDAERAVLRDLVRAQARVSPVLLLLTLLFGWLLAGRALRPVGELSRTMARVSERNLTERVAAPGAATEFAELVDVFNRMIERLEKSFSQASRFSADASHELRTPLTVLHGELESAVMQAPAGSPEQQQFSSLLEEVRRLRVLTDRLLLLSRADAGTLLRRKDPVDLKAMLEEALDGFADWAGPLQVRTHLEPAEVEGDPDLLRQTVMNLLSNARKYNAAEAGWLDVELESRGGQVTLRIRNGGEPIPAEAQPHIFERFYRGDRSRARVIDGLGLGLSLAREIAEAHGGSLILVGSDPEGTCFELHLPLVRNDKG